MISVIIPTYKNKDQLIKNLKANLPYLKGTEVIVINDFPDDNLIDELRAFEIILIENKINLGFAGTVNVGVQRASGKYIMLINSDVILDDMSYKKALTHFEKSNDLFAISFAQKERTGKVVGKNKFFWKRGFFYHSEDYDLEFGMNGWAEGGSCIIDKQKFEVLGGFDTIYKPFYWEDVDLSYRAYKAGYRVIFDPQILVQHHHESTIGKYFQSNTIKKVAYRNQFIFIWKNITDKKLIISHLALLPFNMVYYMFAGQWQYLTGFWEALRKASLIIQLRQRHKKISKLTDTEILNLHHE